MQVNNEFWTAYPIFIKNIFINETEPNQLFIKEED